MMRKVSIDEKFSLFQEHWRPKVVAELNGQELKLVKFKGEFLWHHHESADELFLVWRGSFKVELRDQTIPVSRGEFVVIPRGIEHRTVADEEVEILMFEPADTVNTGNVRDSRLTAPLRSVI